MGIEKPFFNQTTFLLAIIAPGLVMNSEVTEIGLSLSSTRISNKMGVEGVEQGISSFFGILDALNPFLRGTCKTQNQNFGVPLYH